MKSKINLKNLTTVFSLFVCSFLFAKDANASTPALWWSSTEINTNSVSDCATFGGTVLKNSNVANLEITNWTAAGSIGDTSITIGCIGTSPKISALTMVVARTVSDATKQHNIIQSKIGVYPTAPTPPAPIIASTVNKPFNPSMVLKSKTSIDTSVIAAKTEPQTPMYFYWKTFGVKTSTVNKCYELARPDFKGKTNFREIKGAELSFSSGTSYIALKCFQTGSRATAVITVVGDDNTQTQSLFNAISDRISKRVFID